ncbi:unnamed protein product, partial [Rangifer tarandus platyrhynchus]
MAQVAFFPTSLGVPEVFSPSGTPLRSAVPGLRLPPHACDGSPAQLLLLTLRWFCPGYTLQSPRELRNVSMPRLPPAQSRLSLQKTQ